MTFNVSITMVRNERDIIESFVRYHITLFDAMVVLDNSSTDGTLEILANLVREGLPIHIHFDFEPSFTQSECMTKLLYWAKNEFNADWIFPLDVDEFVGSGQLPLTRHQFSRILAGTDPLTLHWHTYVPTCYDEHSELNPLKRLEHCRIRESRTVVKIAIPGSLCENEHLCIEQGSHRITIGGVPLHTRDASPLFLAHYPIRAEDQAVRKYMIGWLANLARPKPALFDWARLYGEAAKCGRIKDDDLTLAAFSYNSPDDRINPGDIIRCPLPLSIEQGQPLRYTTEFGGGWLRELLSFAENLASEYGQVGSRKDLESQPLISQEDISCCLRLWQPDWRMAIREIFRVVTMIRANVVQNSAIILQESGIELAAAAYVALRGFCNSRINIVIDDASQHPRYLTDFLNASCFVQRPKNIQCGSCEIALLYGFTDDASALAAYEKAFDYLSIGGTIALVGIFDNRYMPVRRLADSCIYGNTHWSEPHLIHGIFCAQRV
jgi:hypothetical protein